MPVIVEGVKRLTPSTGHISITIISSMQEIINKVQKDLGIREEFQKAEDGTKSVVFLSDHYVIKINQDNNLIKNEAQVLNSLKCTYSPKVLLYFQHQNMGVLVENKISGQSLEKEWKNQSDEQKEQIIKDLSDFNKNIHSQKKERFWSAQYNQQCENYTDLLAIRFLMHKDQIFQNRQASEYFKKISKYIETAHVQEIFSECKPVLVHGDQIMHNLLIEQGRLSGVLDWEFAQFGDSFYDLVRIIFYQECAKDYVEEERDIHFEYDFTSRLIKELSLQTSFDERKYRVIRSFYFIDSIIWALNSNNPDKNLSELDLPQF